MQFGSGAFLGCCSASQNVSDSQRRESMTEASRISLGSTSCVCKCVLVGGDMRDVGTRYRQDPCSWLRDILQMDNRNEVARM